MKTVLLPDGQSIPALGLGTWRMGEAAGARAGEVAAVRRAFEIGYRVIDTAEMYGEGGAESVVGEAMADAIRAGDLRREDVFVVSKVYPHNAGRTGGSRRVRSQPPASPARYRSTSICCTGEAAFRCRKRSRHSRRCAIATRSVAGASATSMSTICPSCGRCKGGERMRHQPDLLLADRARPGRRTAAMAAAPWHPDDGLFAHRPGRVVAQRKARGDGGPARGLAGPAGTCLDPVATERHGDPEGRAGGASARELRCRRARAERCRDCRARPTTSRRRQKNPRSRCADLPGRVSGDCSAAGLTGTPPPRSCAACGCAIDRRLVRAAVRSRACRCAGAGRRVRGRSDSPSPAA